MLQTGWLATAKAQASTLKADPRFTFIDRVSELTIPTTDTPGASAAGVPVFVLMALDQHVNGLQPALLKTLQQRLDRDAGGNFLSRAPSEQLRLLTALDDEAYSHGEMPRAAALDEQQKAIAARDAKVSAATTNAPLPGDARTGSAVAAWQRIKATIVGGYYTSEIGASDELVYDPVPAKDGTITIGPDYRARSNEGFGGRI